MQIPLPQGFSAKKQADELIISKGGKEAKRVLFNPMVEIKISANEIILESKKDNRNMKKMIMTFESHIKNMIRGLNKPFIYKLKICSSHYPITVKVEGKSVVILNYLGEKVPRKCNIIGGAKVTINKDIILVESHDKEAAGMTAGIIEKTCQIRIHDRRVFQDGIYITEKDGKKI